ncbi:DUF4309 domain-containing protein [Paenibacillus sp. HJL G12]|uniref:DUF4309 domain-containing protein n=1 Tax=Paenibacillus dendrobii TaxID=2691084 RepID=A0A7X3IHV6_9BACL|nr:M56 family metallopeptidase [Paenibacillus dendrobii]MWV43813.1 DUF4309 domain-containing protein [Paenibacillus dendrobii]
MEVLTNPSVNHFFDWVIQTTVLASIMTVLILLIKAVMKNRLKPGWHYVLWLLLMLRLLIPSGPQTEFSIYNLFPWTGAATQSAAIPPAISPGDEGKSPSSPQAFLPAIHPESSGPHTVDSMIGSSNRWSLKRVMISIWLAIAVLLLIHLLAVNLLFSMKLHRKAQPASEDEVMVLEEAKKAMGIRRRVRLTYSSVVPTPTLFGWIRPHLVMPMNSKSLGVEQRQHIYLHELAHMKRGDIVVNWLMHLVLVLHWFNPLLWYALFRMREDQELAADALALRKIEPERVAEYGHTVITLLERTKQRAHIPGAAGLSGSKQQLKRRIIMIKNFRRRSVGWTVVGLALVVALSGCALTNGKTASNGDASPPPATTPAKEAPTETQSDAQGKDAGEGDAQGTKDAQNGSAADTSSKSGTPSSNHTDSNQGSTGSSGAKQTSSGGSVTSGHERQLKDIYALAKKGKVQGADFVAGKTLIDEIHAAWGDPDRPWQPNDRYAYDSYSPGAGRGTYAFGIGRGEVVYDIRYFGSQADKSVAFNQISFAEIQNTFGKPSSMKTNSGDDILTYELGAYELKFVGPHKTARLDHISVYSPKAAAPMGGSTK